jgi:hypothetical protein
MEYMYAISRRHSFIRGRKKLTHRRRRHRRPLCAAAVAGRLSPQTHGQWYVDAEAFE